LSWRGESSPYRIWVAEVMLQQTQVSTVLPYYHRFLARFADVQTLAAAPLAQVLKAWEGLGYYARARNMHRAAIEIVDKYDGRLPQTYAELRTLPGFGDYIAGAVGSVAFGQVVPAVDGNVKRVIARLFALESDITRSPAAQQLKKIAVALVDPNCPGDWTQAIMELGALVCLPKSPACATCPVRETCQGRRRGIERELPVRPKRRTLPHYNVTAAVIRRTDQVLIAQRPLNGMLGGMWEFPGGKQEPGESLTQCLQREIDEELGIDVEVGQPLITVNHSYTHFKITLYAFTCRLIRGSPQPLGVADWRWATIAELDSYPFPRTDQKIIQALKDQEK
jgi:A/G-specific adenine glycosylase